MINAAKFPVGDENVWGRYLIININATGTVGTFVTM